MRSPWLIVVVFFFGLASAADSAVPTTIPSSYSFEAITLDQGGPPATIQLLYQRGEFPRRPVILMLGSLDPKEPPAWSVDLLREGYMLAAFVVAHPPDPDPARRAVWLCFDERFAHGYALAGHHAAGDSGRVIDYLLTRNDVNPQKIGWLGSSSTGIPALAAVTRERRIAAVVAFVSTGSYREWLATWKTNGLWSGKTDKLWPETEKLLDEDDPILHVQSLFPVAVLMVNGGDDKVVDPKPARHFAAAARPFYARDPGRFRLVMYEGFGHNLPIDVVKLHAEHWFHLYLHPTNPPPAPPSTAPATLDQSVKQTQINSADHRGVIGAGK